MNLPVNLRSLLLATSAGLALAACSGGDISSPGVTEPIGSAIGGGSSDDDGADDDAGVALDLTFGGCPGNTTAAMIPGSDVLACQVLVDSSGLLLSNTTLTASQFEPRTYFFDQPAFIGTDDGPTAGALNGTSVTLTIEGGAQIAFVNSLDFLTVNRGSQIVADGDPTAPIVFTADEDIVDNGLADGLPGGVSGLWGGLIINGRAPINSCADPSVPASCETSGEGGTGLYGGDDPNDNSGILEYVRVQHAGFEITDDNELNGIAFQGVGDGTLVDFIQVHNNDDDGVEFFGGTVDVRHVVITGSDDDAFDWVAGWNGSAQDVLIIGSGVGDNGFEGDNNSSNNSVVPTSNPMISNFTMLGNSTEDLGMQLRVGTGGTFINGIVTGWEDGCLDIDDQATFDNIDGSATIDIGGVDLQISSVVFTCDTPFDDTANDPLDLATTFAGITVGTPADSTLSAGDINGTPQVPPTVIPGMFESNIAAIDPTTIGVAEFARAGEAPETFVGAFEPGIAPEDTWAFGWTVPGTVFEVGCPDSPNVIDITASSAVTPPPGGAICQISGILANDLTLTPFNFYALAGGVVVGSDVGPDNSDENDGNPVSLNIQAGTTIFGTNPTDFLVIARGSQINATGTPSAPIVFTADEDLLGTVGPSDRGLWGGLIINGQAPINSCADPSVPSACETSGEGGTGLYGGDDPTDNSGILNYVRVQFAGFEITPDNELNGIAFQGVGNGTLVDFVQVHNNDDDGIEFFGGTVDASHLVITGVDDDALDWVSGWNGSAQFVIVAGDGSGDNGFEGDSNASNNAIVPASDPVISNYTLIGGPGEDLGMQIRVGTAGIFMNGVVSQWGDACLDIDDPVTLGRINPSLTPITNEAPGQEQLQILSNFFTCETALDDFDGEPLTDTNIGTMLPGITIAAPADSTLVTAPGFTVPFINGSAENAVAVTDPQSADPDLAPVSQIGALANPADTWFVGWTAPGSL